MLQELKITRSQNLRVNQSPLDQIEFGNIFSDHMFSMIYEDGDWQRQEILPYGDISIPPTSIAIQYGQTVFEGLKAYRGDDGKIRLFRPFENARRLRESCERLCIPTIDDRIFVEAVSSLVREDAAWVPDHPGSALYIRPIVFSVEGHIGVRPSQRYRFVIVTTPVRDYFKNQTTGLALKVEETFSRTAPHGGLGNAKTAANYASTILSSANSIREGFDQVLWLDGAEHRYVEEAGLMNVFFRIEDTFITPEIGDSVLPGVTRDSLIRLIRGRGISVDECRIPIDTIRQAAVDGTLQEMFACGTAAVVSPIGRLSYRGQVITQVEPVPGPMTAALFAELTGIQYGRAPDPNLWIYIVV